MGQQVITIKPDGTVFGLQHKKNQGLDLRSLGEAAIKRATLIEFDEKEQAWTIRWTHQNATQWTLSVFQQTSQLETLKAVRTRHSASSEAVVFFEDYEDAVKLEVAVIQALQLSGEKIN